MASICMEKHHNESEEEYEEALAGSQYCGLQKYNSPEEYEEEEYSSEDEYAGKPLKDISDKAIRHGFIQKVYTILSLQLGITTATAAAIMYFGSALKENHPILVQLAVWLSILGTLALVCGMTCFPQVMRQTPQNYILLFLFTVLESLLVGFICTFYKTGSVLFVTFITGFVVLGLTAFACQTKYDFTGMGPYLYAALLVLVAGSFCMIVARLFIPSGTPGFHTISQVLAVFGALLFSFYIVFDTQLIVGGKHKKHEFNVDDYCFAALNLYLDIINLFLYLLQLFGKR